MIRVVMITDETGDGAPAEAPPSLNGVVTAIIATYWPDVDAVWERAVAAGAEVVYPLADQFYGERGGLARPVRAAVDVSASASRTWRPRR